MNVPALTPTYLIATVATVVGLFVTQNVITNNIGQLVTGLASVLIPLAFAVLKTSQANAKTHAVSRVEAARIHAAPARSHKAVVPK